VQQLFQSLQSANQTANTSSAAQTNATSTIATALQGFSLGFTLTGRARWGSWSSGPGVLASGPVFDSSNRTRGFTATIKNGRFTGSFSDGQVFG